MRNGTWLGDNFLFEPDNAYWVQIRPTHPGVYINLTGEVPGQRTIDIQVGWNFVGYTSLNSTELTQGQLDTSGLYDDGMTGAMNQDGSDRVYAWTGASWDVQWMWMNPGDPSWDGTWVGTTLSLAPGEGYWIQIRPAHAGFNWVIEN